jgi:hypothetical protein
MAEDKNQIAGNGILAFFLASAISPLFSVLCHLISDLTPFKNKIRNYVLA